MKYTTKGGSTVEVLYTPANVAAAEAAGWTKIKPKKAPKKKAD